MGLLLWNAAACSSKKNDEPTPAPTASYQLNGQQVTCQVRAAASTDAGYDYLEMICTTTPQPTSGAETLHVLFYKASSSPNTAYEVADIFFKNSDHPQDAPFDNDMATLEPNSDGSFSGSFSGRRTELAGTIYQKDYVLTAGTFANVRP
ncbi:hypothetical protein [Hymenobacter guriensis]|uniref:Lipoprotein n=1 Tax=Hymenobacter guriensis TaxID=2793065 RepID=A0ABS0L241_9BACT|nr:hypothetical protein [Hymenobacter guriensis]MBG8554183.1 hypothetical protein [Hymenobacter guriensis]